MTFAEQKDFAVERIEKLVGLLIEKVPEEQMGELIKIVCQNEIAFWTKVLREG